MPWLANASWYFADHRPDAAVVSAHACRPAAPASSRRPSATADDDEPTSETARTANGSEPVGVGAPAGGRNVIVDLRLLAGQHRHGRRLDRGEARRLADDLDAVRLDPPALVAHPDRQPRFLARPGRHGVGGEDDDRIHSAASHDRR